MAGKTGTAQKFITRHEENGKMVKGHYSKEKYISTFVGFFPVDKPRYSCIVVIHSADKSLGYTGGRVAGPVFKEIAENIYATRTIGFEKTYDSISISKDISKDYQNYYSKLNKYKKLSDKEVGVMPNVVGMGGMDAVSLLENMGLEVKFKGLGKVKEQSIKPNENVHKGAVVYLNM